MRSERPDVARAYIRYRYNREQARILQNDLQKRYEKIESLICGTDEESKKENSNKDTRIIPTMRDYIAGFTCRELADRIILPKDVAEAHKAGIIHFHDSDYSPAMPMNNCGLINLKDMFENGTVISGV
uniref:Anaerobic ribonucleoside triphosphate reductase n=1 Tax=Siphoviridae sp. ctxMM9 TaxID=2827973 RepID=A0A8S5T5S2_9CAUD|nr:MAG TPA: anaerobic ribonucleoside triphosphate reductase [Siphoviridae sp. ctxMM9]